MTRDELLALREDADFEAKSAQGRDGQGDLPQSVWQTYSAMANTDGGRILLGAKERADGSLLLQGIADPQRLRKTLWDGLNNRHVVSHNLLRNADVEVLAVDGLQHPVVLVKVPRAKRKERPVYLGQNPLTGSYKRNYEGDYHCTKAEVRRMLAEAERDARDSEVLKGFGLDDLDPESLGAFRNLFHAAKPAHPWLALDDPGLLRRLGGWGRDREQNVEGLTLAGLLMFGEIHTIREALPDYILDYQEHMSPDARWTDRVTTDGTWSGNLFDFYRRVYPRLVEGLKVPFRLEAGARRVDDTPVHVALREALVNTIIHADYHLSTGIVVHKHADRFEFSNPGNLRVPRSRAFQGGVSDCRNRSLQKMFQMIGAGEQAGSGLPRIVSAWEEQHWRAPLLEEEAEPERTTLRLSMYSLLSGEVIAELVDRIGEVYRSLPEVERLALATAQIEGKVTNERLREISSEHPSDLTAHLRKLVGRGFLERHGNGRGAYYKLPAPTGTDGTASNEPTHSGGLSSRQRVAVDWVRQHGSISNDQYRKLVGVSRATAFRDLQELVSRDILSKQGETSATQYVLTSERLDDDPNL